MNLGVQVYIGNMTPVENLWSAEIDQLSMEVGLVGACSEIISSVSIMSTLWLRYFATTVASLSSDIGLLQFTGVLMSNLLTEFQK